MSADANGFNSTDEIRRAENIFHNTGRNFLILGSAGTGKSVLLKRLMETSKKNVQVLAFTGLAALQVGGRTIHSFFGFDLGLQKRSHLLIKRSDEQRENRRRAFLHPYHATRAENWPRHWSVPVPEVLEIKKGTRVLVCANHAGPGLVNGSLGTVLRFDDDEVVLQVGSEEVPVRRYVWNFPIWRWDRDQKKMIKDSETWFSQMPLKHAWAMTIHKAQGQTVDGPMWVNFGQRV